MKQKIIIFLFCLLFLLVLYAKKDRDAPITKLSLDVALKTAYKERSSLQSRKYRTKQQMDLEWVALSSYFPQANFRTEVNKTARNLLPKHQTFISISQVIINVSPLLRNKVEKQNTKIAKLDEEFHKDLIQFETETSYIDLWDIVKQHNVTRAIEYSAEKQIAQAETQDMVGLLNSTEWLDEVARFEEDMAAVKSYKDNLSRAYYTLERAIEEKITMPLHDHATAQFIRYSINSARRHPLDYYLKKAMLHRKEISIVETEIKREEYLEKLFGYSYIPTVSFFFDISNGTFFSLFDNGVDQTFWQVGLRFGWNFDGLGNAHRSNAAHNSILERTFEKKNVIIQIKLEVEIAYYDLQDLLKRLKAAKIRIKQAEQEYLQRTAQLKVGDISLDDFAIAERNWQQAQFDLLDLKVSNARKYRELLFRCGYPENNNWFISIYG